MTLRKKHTERGVTLLETLLVVGTLALLIAVGTTIISRLTVQTANELAARQILKIQNAGEDFVKTNFAQLVNPATPNNIAAANSTRILSVNDLIAGNYVGPGTSDINTLGLVMRVYLRNATNGGQNAIEVITVTEGRPSTAMGRELSRLFDVASFGRGRIGILGNGIPYNTTNFRSGSNEWSVPVGDLTGYTVGAPVTPPANSVPTGFIAAYGRISSDNIVVDADVLYRTPIAGQPQLNQMTTNLNMNGRNITNVSAITTDRVNTGTLALSGAGGDYALTTQTTLTAVGPMRVGGALAIYADNNNATTDFSAPTINAGTGTITANTLGGNSLVVGGGGLVTRTLGAGSAVTGELVVNDRMTVSGTSIAAPRLQLGANGGATGPTLGTGAIQTSSVVAGTIDSTGTLRGSGTGNNVTVTNNLAVQGTASITRTATQLPELQLQDLCYTAPPGGTETNVRPCP